MPNSRDQLHMLPCESQNRRMPASRQSREIVETGEKYQTKVLVRTKDQSPAIHRENSFKSSTQVSLDLKVKWGGRRMRWSQSSNSVSLWPQLPLPLTLTYKTNRCLLEWKMRSTGGSGILEDHYHFYQQQKNVLTN